MQRYNVWRAGDGYRLSTPSIFRERLVWLYPTSNETGVELCEMETVRTIFQPNQQQVFSLVLAALGIKSTIDEKLV